jgi:DUF1680 family protein
MHGYRAFPDVLSSIVRSAGGTAHVDLFLDADFSGDGVQLSLRQQPLSPLQSRVTVDVRAAKGTALALRRPSWAEAVRVTVNGAAAQVGESDGYLRLERPPKAGDRITAELEHRVAIETRDGRRLAPGQLGEGVEGLLAVGPLLYAVDDGQEPLFFGEPWLAGNVVRLPAKLEAAPAAGQAARFSSPARHVVARYEHSGFAGTHPVTLRPVGEQAGREPGIMAAWLRYRS